MLDFPDNFVHDLSLLLTVTNSITYKSIISVVVDFLAAFDLKMKNQNNLQMCISSFEMCNDITFVNKTRSSHQIIYNV